VRAVKYLVDTFEWLLSLGDGGGGPTVQNREAARRWRKDEATATATVLLPCRSNS
jgi:alpha-mannosidase